MDVAAWLRGLGLGEYEAAFRESHIEPDLLAELTDKDLRELGVASLGHRKRLLRAARGLGGGGGPSPTLPPARRAAPEPAAATADRDFDDLAARAILDRSALEGERKLVTSS